MIPVNTSVLNFGPTDTVKLGPGNTVTNSSAFSNPSSEANLALTGKNFQAIKPGDNTGDKELERILKLLEVGKNKYNHAAIHSNPNNSEDDALVVSMDGKTAQKQFFNQNFIYRFLGWIPRLMGSRDKSWAHKLYQDIYDPDHNKELTHRGESRQQLEKSLSEGDYHLVVLYQKNEKGKWKKDPSIALVTDSYYRVLHRDPSNSASKDALMKEFKHSITVDKVLASHRIDDYKLRLAELIEGLFSAQKSKIDMLFVRERIARESLSKNLDIVELSQWQHPAQKVDHSWEILKDHASIIRPSVHRGKPADPRIANLQAAVVTSTGADKLVKDPSHEEIIEKAIENNRTILEQYNAFIQNNSQTSRQAT